MSDDKILEKLKSLSKSASNSGLPIGSVNISLVAKFHKNIFDVIKSLNPVTAIYPQTFEQLSVRHGFVFYQTTIPSSVSDSNILDCSNVHDRAHVFVNNIYHGIVSQLDHVHKLKLYNLKEGDKLQLFVENQGHPCCGGFPGHLDQKVCAYNFFYNSLV